MLLGKTAGDVLSNAHHTNYIALIVAPPYGIEEHVKLSTSLGYEWDLEGCILLAVQHLVQHSLYRGL